MLKEAEFNWNLDMDAAKIRDALEDLEQRLEVQEERLNDEEQEQENDEQPEIKWPSISNR